MRSTTRPIEVSFQGTEIDRIIDFCHLIELHKRTGIMVLATILRPSTDIVAPEDSEIVIDQAPRLTEYIKNRIRDQLDQEYRRTFEIPLDSLCSLEVGGKNAIREDIALDSLRLQIKFNLDPTPSNISDFFSAIYKNPQDGDNKLFQLRKWLLSNSLEKRQLNNLKNRLLRLIDENREGTLGGSGQAHTLVTVMEDLNDRELLLDVAERFSIYNRFFRHYFSRCLKTVFQTLPPEKNALPTQIIRNTFNDGYLAPGASPLQGMLVCEACWFFPEMSKVLAESLLKIASNKDNNNNVRAAALCSASRYRKLRKDLQPQFLDIIKGILKGHGDNELKIVAWSVFGDAFDREYLPSKKDIKMITSALEENEEGEFHNKIQKVTALTLSTLLRKTSSMIADQRGVLRKVFFWTEDRKDAMRRAFEAVADIWFNTTDKDTRKACATALIEFMYHGFNPRMLDFNVRNEQSIIDAGKWSIRQLSFLEEDNIKEYIKEKNISQSADLKSMAVALFCEQFNLTCKIGILLSRQYINVPSWSRLRDLFIAHADAEESITNPGIDYNEILKKLGKCITIIGDLTRITGSRGQRYFIMAEIIKSRKFFIMVFRGELTRVKEEACNLFKLISETIKNQSDYYPHIDIFLVQSLEMLIELAHCDLEQESEEKMFHLSIALNKAQRLAERSLSSNLRTALEEYTGLPVLHRESPVDEPITPNLGEIFLSIVLNAFSKIGLGGWRKKRAMKIITVDIPLMSKKLGDTPHRLIGLISIARDIVW